MSKLNQNTIMNMNLDPGSIDMHQEALANNPSIRADGGKAQHDIIKQQVRNSRKVTSDSGIKEIQNSDDMYSKIMNMKKSGLLPEMLQRAGINKTYLREDSMGAGGGMAVGGGSPMGGAPVTVSGSEPQASFGGGAMKKIKNCYNQVCKGGK